MFFVFLFCNSSTIKIMRFRIYIKTANFADDFNYNDCIEKYDNKISDDDLSHY